MASLSQLSQEVLLRIVAWLDTPEDAPHVHTRTDEHVHSFPWTDYIVKSEGRKSLPSAIWNLSRACTAFYNILSPRLYRDPLLRSTEKSGKSISRLQSSKQAEHVRSLHYTCYCPGNDENDKDIPDEADMVLPSAVSSVLETLSRFPNLTALLVEFDCGFEDHYRWDRNNDPDFLDILGDRSVPETDEEILEHETKEPWQALMAHSWRAIAATPPGHIKSLYMRDAIIKETSVFRTDPWRNFLNGLEEFKLLTMVWDNGACWKLNKCPPYLAFTANMAQPFLNHFASLKILTLGGNDSGPIGNEGRNYVPHDLRANQMPKLEELHLRYFFLDNPLVDFLIGKSESLRCVTLTRCFSPLAEAKAPIKWHEFFDRWADANPSALTFLDIEPKAPLKEPGVVESCGEIEITEDQAELIKTLLAEQKERNWVDGRIMFNYAELNEKYAATIGRDEEDFNNYLLEKDWRAHQRLMKIMAVNRGEDLLKA